jgi:hypothetical protein
MISRIIKDKVCVIHRSRRLRWITQTEALIILDIMRKPNPIIVLLYIQKQDAKNNASGIAININCKNNETFVPCNNISKASKRQ